MGGEGVIVRISHNRVLFLKGKGNNPDRPVPSFKMGPLKRSTTQAPSPLDPIILGRQRPRRALQGLWEPQSLGTPLGIADSLIGLTPPPSVY